MPRALLHRQQSTTGDASPTPCLVLLIELGVEALSVSRLDKCLLLRAQTLIKQQGMGGLHGGGDDVAIDSR